jgi:uncharacterized protein (TIGR03067 family)
MNTRVVCGLCVLLLTSSAALSGDAAKDQKGLQGTWVSEDGPLLIELRISGKNWEMRDKEKLFVKGTFTLDAKMSPRAINMLVDDGSTDAAKFKGRTALGIYELMGDTFKWCASEPGQNARPKVFAEEDKGKVILLKFKRSN